MNEPLELAQMQTYVYLLADKPWKLDLGARELGRLTVAELTHQLLLAAQQLPRGHHLATINLQDNHLPSKAAASIAALVKRHKQIRHVNLSSNKLGDEGIAYFCQELINISRKSVVLDGEMTALTLLDASENRIGHIGAATMAETLIINAFLVCPVLETIVLRDNPIGTVGAESLARAILEAAGSNPSKSAGERVLALRYLDVTGCDLAATGRARLLEAAQTVNKAGIPLKIVGLDNSKVSKVPEPEPLRGPVPLPPAGRRLSAAAQMPASAGERNAFEAPMGQESNITVPVQEEPAIIASTSAAEPQQSTEPQPAAESVKGEEKAEQNVVEMFQHYVSSQVEAAVAERTAALESLVRTMQAELASLKATPGASAAPQPKDARPPPEVSHTSRFLKDRSRAVASRALVECPLMLAPVKSR
jgi:hypothetical protein